MSAHLAAVMTQNDREMLENQIYNMREDLSDMKGSMKTVAEALTKLAVLEERHQTVAAATNKILSRIEKMEERQILSDKREFAYAELEKKVVQYDSRVKSLEDAKNIQDGKIRGMTTVITVLWTVIASTGLIGLVAGIFL